jgi:hypothetical protein
MCWTLDIIHLGFKISAISLSLIWITDEEGPTLSDTVYLLIWIWVVWLRYCFEISAGWWTLRSISDRGLERTIPANSGHGDVGQGHGCDREVVRNSLIPLSVVGDHRKRWKGHTTPIGTDWVINWFQMIFLWFPSINWLFEIMWNLWRYWNTNFLFNEALNMIWALQLRF